MRRCIYAGSFDPLTNGHLWMIRQGSKLFDRLIVAIGVNPDKKTMLSLDERIALLKQSTLNIPNVQVQSFSGRFLAEFASTQEVGFILRGIRTESDYEYERGMRYMNETINRDLTTVFLIPPRELIETSSSMIKGLIGPTGWESIVNDQVPAPVFQALLVKYLEGHFQKTWERVSKLAYRPIFNDLVSRYLEPHRAYHTLEHIAACLGQMQHFETDDTVRSKIELAIWFHDAVYDTQSGSNEEKSAELFLKSTGMQSTDVPHGLYADVSDMIRATKTHQPVDSFGSMDIFLDIDLSILGSNDRTYRRYAQNIEKEYSWVPRETYVAKRTEILTKFLHNPNVFRTETGKRLFQDGMVVNVGNEIANLQKSL